MARSSGKKRKGPALTYRQRQHARATALSRRLAINQDVDALIKVIDNEARRLSKKHHRSVAWFQHQFFQGGRVTRQKRAVNVFNAAQQIKSFLDGRKGDITEAEKTCFEEIQGKLRDLGGTEFASKLPIDLQEFLRNKCQTWRDNKYTAPLASTRAVVQDARLTLERVVDELIALNGRTDVESILFAVKGRPEHSVEGFFAASNKGSRYLLNGMKRHTSDIIKEFEAYVLGDVEGLILNHNGRLAECKATIRRLIREGLVAITGDPKAAMQYDRYEKLIVVEMGVELTNWPGDVPFRTVSDIGAFHHLRRLRDALTLADPEERCKWVNLPEEDWNSRKAAYQKKEAYTLPKKRKRKKAPAVVDSDSQSGSDPWSDDQLEGTGRKKKTKKTTGADEENLPTAPETAFQTTNVGCAAKRKGVAAVKERALAKGKGVVAAKRGTFTKGKSVVAAKGRALAKDKGKAALINQDVNKEPYASLVPAT